MMVPIVSYRIVDVLRRDDGQETDSEPDREGEALEKQGRILRESCRARNTGLWRYFTIGICLKLITDCSGVGLLVHATSRAVAPVRTMLG